MLKVRYIICCIIFLIFQYYMGQSAVFAENTKINDKLQKCSIIQQRWEQIYSRKKRYLLFLPGSVITVSIIIIDDLLVRGILIFLLGHIFIYKSNPLQIHVV